MLYYNQRASRLLCQRIVASGTSPSFCYSDVSNSASRLGRELTRFSQESAVECQADQERRQVVDSPEEYRGQHRLL
jgi:hypothetical protein